MSISSIPSNFLAGPGGSGVRGLLTQETLDLVWSSRPTAQQEQIAKEATIPPPPSNFLADANITSLARESAWLNLTDEQRALFLADAPPGSSSGLISSGEGASSFRTPGFGSTTNTDAEPTTPLDFVDRTGPLSQVPTTDTATAYRAIWSTDAAFASVLSNDPLSANGGAILVSFRAGATGPDAGTSERFIQNPYTDDPTRSDDSFDLFEAQATNQQNDVLARFGTDQGLLGYDLNGNGFIDDETELFGFDSPEGAGLSLDQVFAGYTPATGPLRLDDANGFGDRLMVLRSDGTSVKLDQSSIATSPVGAEFAPYTSVQTVLQTDGDGRLEVVAYARQGTTFTSTIPPADQELTIPPGQPLSFLDRLDEASQSPSGATTTAYTSLYADAAALAAVLSPASADGGNGSAIFVTVRTGTGPDERATNPFDPVTEAADFAAFEGQVDAQTDGMVNTLLGGSGVTQLLIARDVNGNGNFDGEEELFGFDDVTAGPNFSALFAALDQPGERVNLTDTVAFGGELDTLFVVRPDGTWQQLARTDTALGAPNESTAVTVLQRDAANNLEVVVYSRPQGGTVTNTFV